MRAIQTELADLLLMEPTVFADARGFFFESFNARVFEELTGSKADFVQDNYSGTRQGGLRGLHYQLQFPQSKLVRVTSGEILDVVVDIRRSSPTFGKSQRFRLSAENRRQLWVPAGFAHGFIALSPVAEVQYKTSQYWARDDEYCILWNDPALAIDWEYDGEITLSDKDKNGVLLADAKVFP